MSAEQDLANANVQIANLISEVTRFRDAAMGINNLWPTITEGRQNTADGKYFSVPGDGAYLKLYRRAGSSQTLIAEFPDRAQVQGIVDTFAGRGVVGGSGDLMAAGAGGLLSLSGAAISDLYGERENGFYSTESLTEGRPSTGIGPVIQMNRAATRKGFITLTDAAGGRMYFNAEGGAGFGPLKEVYHTGNVLGALPGPSLFEKVTNSYGTYFKIKGGLLICLRYISNFDVSALGNNTIGPTPHPFVGDPIWCGISPRGAFGSGVDAFRTIVASVDGSLFRFRQTDNGNSYAGTHPAVMIAVGFWE